MERNRTKNRSPENQIAGPIDSLDTATFLKKFAAYGAYAPGKRRSGLTAEQKGPTEFTRKADRIAHGWLNLAYAGPPETTNCGNAIFHDWHLEIFENPSDHAPQVGDPTPIICEITPRTEQTLFREGIRIQSLTGFCGYRTGASKRPDIRRKRFA